VPGRPGSRSAAHRLSWKIIPSAPGQSLDGEWKIENVQGPTANGAFYHGYYDAIGNWHQFTQDSMRNALGGGKERWLDLYFFHPFIQPPAPGTYTADLVFTYRGTGHTQDQVHRVRLVAVVP
jgi:hypothetical protein